MTGSHVISLLSKKYAKLLGEFEFAERQVGDAFGLQAIIAATERSDRRKRDIEEKLEAIETVIWLFDPNWDPALVSPNYPRETHKAPGEISKAAYGVLRQAPAPLTTRELAKAVAAVLGYREAAERDLARIEGAIYRSLSKRVGKTVRIENQHPIRWALIPRDHVAGSKPRRPSSRLPAPSPINNSPTKGNEPNQEWETGD